MDPSGQPPMQPVAPQPVVPQPPIMNVVQPPKKKKTGLIIGIVAGIVALIAIIVTIVLVLVFGGGDPQKLVSEAAANAVLTERARMAGTMTIKSDDMKVVAEIKTSSDQPKNKFDVDLTFEPKSMDQPLKMNFSGVYGANGTMFIKAGNLDRVLDAALDAMLDNSSQGRRLTPMERQRLRQALLEDMKQVGIDLERMVRTLNDQWIRISPDDFKQMTTNEGAECSPLRLMQDFNKSDARQELADALRRQPIALKKDAVMKDRNGGRGFEIDLKAQSPVDSPVRDTKIAKALSRCADKSSSKSEDAALPDTIRLWVNPSTRQFTAFEAKQENKDGSFELALTIDMGESDEISEPSGARSLEDISRQFNVTPRDFSDKLPLGGGRGTFSI